jgi:hypothetical protein
MQDSENGGASGGTETKDINRKLKMKIYENRVGR